MAKVAVAVEQPDEWQAAHAALLELARRRAGLDFDEGRWLLRARHSQAHARLGYGSFTEYIERIFGYSPRLTHDKLRVAEALESLPEMAQALRQGVASWSSIRELTRVATPDTEHAWLEQSRGRTAREVEKLVSGQRPGSLPGEPADPSLQRHTLRFEVTGEVLAIFREALSKLRRDAGGHLDDDDTLLLMARHVLGGPVDDGRASYQVELTVCDRCERALQLGNGELLEVSPRAAEMAKCDAQQLATAHRGGNPPRVSQEGNQPRASQDGNPPRASQNGNPPRASQDSQPPRVSQNGNPPRVSQNGNPPRVSQNGNPPRASQVGNPPRVSQNGNPPRASQHGEPPRVSQNGNSPRASQHGEPPRVSQNGRPPRATQEVPPAVRRAVLRRDQHCCQVPGCRHADFVDLHHVQPREEGGQHDPENLITLCAAHHRACHGGSLSVTGSPSTGLRFRHADGTSYGTAVSAPSAARSTQAFQALRALGFKEKPARDALAWATAHVGDSADLQLLLRHALQRLTEHAWQRSA